MTGGTLGVIACPMLEDGLIYSLGPAESIYAEAKGHLRSTGK